MTATHGNGKNDNGDGNNVTFMYKLVRAKPKKGVRCFFVLDAHTHTSE
jgi:hypothetical protein